MHRAPQALQVQSYRCTHLNNYYYTLFLPKKGLVRHHDAVMQTSCGQRLALRCQIPSPDWTRQNQLQARPNHPWAQCLVFIPPPASRGHQPMHTYMILCTIYRSNNMEGTIYQCACIHVHGNFCAGRKAEPNAQISYINLPHAPTSAAAASSAGDRSAQKPDQAHARVQSSSAQPQETGRVARGASDAWSVNGPSSCPWENQAAGAGC